MKVTCIGGGPAGLYLAILMKKADARHDVRVVERNRADDTFGFGVVFSDATLGNLAEADAASHREITRAFAHWDDIEIHARGGVVRSTGHGFSGIDRRRLLQILQERARELDVILEHDREVTDVAALAAECDVLVGADGVNSLVRESYARALEPRVDWRPNRFVWLGTTFPFEAFTFYFKENEHGLWRVHAYRYAPDSSTFIVETTEAAWRAAGLAAASEDETIAYLQELFAAELRGHPLRRNRSVWRRFPTVTCGRWHAGNVVLVGDAAHTAHFSIGSGTKLALEDAIALAGALGAEVDPGRALEVYERVRRPQVEALQRAAQVSLEWFEGTERYLGLPVEQLAFSCLTRSLRVSHDGLARRDPELVARLDRWFSGDAVSDRVQRPSLTQYQLGGLALANRSVWASSPQGAFEPDWQQVHLGARALAGVALVLAEPRLATVEPGWKQVVSFFERFTPTHLGAVLAHPGPRGADPVAASPLGAPVPRVPDEDERRELRRSFERGAKQAANAGFHVLCLDLASGGLLASFLSPLTNERRDALGGDVAGRLRFPLEVVAAVRAIWRGPLLARIAADDWAPGGTTPADAVAIARALGAAGVELVIVDGGRTVRHERRPRGRLPLAALTDTIRNEAGVPVAAVDVASLDDADSLLLAARADLVVSTDPIARADRPPPAG